MQIQIKKKLILIYDCPIVNSLYIRGLAEIQRNSLHNFCIYDQFIITMT